MDKKVFRTWILWYWFSKNDSSILIETCLEKLNNINAKKVFLVSNTKLEIAISLYKKYKFRVIKQEEHPVYKRANIEMELKIL